MARARTPLAARGAPPTPRARRAKTAPAPGGQKESSDCLTCMPQPQPRAQLLKQLSWRWQTRAPESDAAQAGEVGGPRRQVMHRSPRACSRADEAACGYATLKTSTLLQGQQRNGTYARRAPRSRLRHSHSHAPAPASVASTRCEGGRQGCSRTSLGWPCEDPRTGTVPAATPTPASLCAVRPSHALGENRGVRCQGRAPTGGAHREQGEARRTVEEGGKQQALLRM